MSSHPRGGYSAAPTSGQVRITALQRVRRDLENLTTKPFTIKEGPEVSLTDISELISIADPPKKLQNKVVRTTSNNREKYAPGSSSSGTALAEEDLLF